MSRLFLVLLLWALVAKLAGQNVTNYTFSAVGGTYTAIQGSPGSVSPAVSGGTSDDGWYNGIPIGFTFLYEGTGYTTLAASTNGWIRIGGTLAASGFTNNINTGTPRPIIAPLWDDLETTAGNFTYVTTGVTPNRVCTVEWLNAEWNYNSTAAISFQVKLYEQNRRIEFVYRQQAGATNAPSASIGIGGINSGQYISLTNTSAAPGTSIVAETTTLNLKPATGQIYRFDHYAYIPVIVSVNPVMGFVNSVVTITGSGFEPVANQNIVHCGAVRGNVFSATTTQLLVTVPPGTNFEHITVTSALSNLTAESNESYDVLYTCGSYVGLSTYAPFVNFPIIAHTRPVYLQDIDGDGKSEVIAGTDIAGGTALVYQNTSTTGSFNAGSLAAPVAFSLAHAPKSITFSDVDGDGKKDMLVGCYNAFPDSVTVYRNTSTAGTINSGSFGPKVNFVTGGYPTAICTDINGDGKPEMLTACQAADQLRVRQNQATSGTITGTSFGAEVIFATPDYPQSIDAGDIDGDGKMDIVTANSTATTISIFRNAGLAGAISAASFDPRIDIPSFAAPMDATIADLDGDGKMDIVCVNQGGSGPRVSLFRNTSTPGVVSFAARVDLVTPFMLYNITTADVDGDGKTDLLIPYANVSNLIGVMKNNSTPGTLSFGASVNFSGGNNPFDIAVGDLDNDSKPELVVGCLNGATSAVNVLYNTTSALSTIAPATVMGSTVYCDNNVWKTYYNPLDITKVLFAVKDNGNNLGTITVDEYRDAAPGNYLGNRYLQRHFRVTPTAQPLSPVQIRLYFTNAELTNLQAVDPSVTSVASLSVTKYNGPTEDGTYNPLDATSLLWYPPGSITPGIAYGERYLEFTISSFSEFWIHGGTGVLPIELLTFEAHAIDQVAQLHWETASETNNDYFVVERSKDGSTIEKVDTVDGAGTSTSLRQYDYTDVKPYTGESYYRLTQVDFNGHTTQSEWKAVYFEPPVSITVFPNPTAGNLTVSIPGETDILWDLSIVNLAGQKIYEKYGSNDELRYLHLEIAAGTYFLQVVSGDQSNTTKLIVTE